MPRFHGIPVEETRFIEKQGGRFGGEPISAVTGEPVLSGEETIKQTGEAWKTLAPIIGDVGLTLIAPQSKAVTWPAKGLNLLSRMVASGAGSFGGSLVGQKIAGEDVSFAEAGKEAGVGAGAEALLTGAGAGAKLIGKPALELATGLTPFAKKLERRMAKGVRAEQKAMMEVETDAAEKFIHDIAPDVVRKQDVPIDDLDLKVVQAKQETGVIYDRYEEALDAYAKQNDGIIHMDDTSQLLNDLREGTTAISKVPQIKPKGSRLQKDNAMFKKFGLSVSNREELLPLLRDIEGLNPKSIKYVLATMNKNYMKLPPTKREMLDKLKEAILNDIGRAAGAKNLKQEADLLFKETKRFLNIKKLFDVGKWTDRSGRHYIQPYSIAKKIYAEKKKILDPKFGSPELWPKLKELADHYSEIYPRFQKIEVDDAFDLIKAWQTVSSRSQKILGGIAGIGKQTVKGVGKAALHLGGRAVNFPNEVDF